MSDRGPAAAAIAPRMIGFEGDVISNALSFARSYLSMEVAYLGEVVGDDLVFRVAIAPGFEGVIEEGLSLPFKTTLCQHIVKGRLPEVIPDIADNAFAQTVAVLKIVPIRSLVSIPIHRLDGTLFGVFCCFDRAAHPSLNARDLEVMRAFASLSADQVNTGLSMDSAAQTKRAAIEGVLRDQAFEIALQPILHLKDQGTAGYEALCRFSPEPYRPPNLWFEDAAEVGLQVALEVHVIETAFKILPDLPAACYLAVNTSPATLATGKLSDLVAAAGGNRVVIEITEHSAIDDLDVLLMEIDRLRELGARIAVDDAGAGYSGLQQIIRLRPDVIKLDMSLTQNVDKDVARRALASAMVQFARDTNARVVAEGIETEAELRTLKAIGVEMGQGYHLGRPALSSAVLALPKTA